MTLTLKLNLTAEETDKLLAMLHDAGEKELFNKVCDAEFNAAINQEG